MLAALSNIVWMIKRPKWEILYSLFLRYGSKGLQVIIRRSTAGVELVHEKFDHMHHLGDTDHTIFG